MGNEKPAQAKTAADLEAFAQVFAKIAGRCTAMAKRLRETGVDSVELKYLKTFTDDMASASRMAILLEGQVDLAISQKIAGIDAPPASNSRPKSMKEAAKNLKAKRSIRSKRSN